jgi:hypothetical protein
MSEDIYTPAVGAIYMAKNGGYQRRVTGLGPVEGAPSTREIGATKTGGYTVHYQAETKAGWGKERSCYISTWCQWVGSRGGGR